MENDEKPSNVTPLFPEEDAAASPDYEDDMRQDAMDIAAHLRGQIESQFPGTKVHIARGVVTSNTHSPLPTLESLRAMLVGVEPSFAAMVDAYRKERSEAHIDGQAASVLEYLHLGKTTLLRGLMAVGLDAAVVSELDHDEVRDYIAVKQQDNPLFGCAIGMYLGAFLTRSGRSIAEVIDLAKDPVFRAHALALRVTPATVDEHAVEALTYVETQKQTAAKKRVD